VRQRLHRVTQRFRAQILRRAQRFRRRSAQIRRSSFGFADRGLHSDIAGQRAQPCGRAQACPRVGVYSNTTLVNFVPALAQGGTVIHQSKFDAFNFLRLSELQRATPRDAHLHQDKLHTVGRPAIGHEFHVIDDAGRVLRRGDIGEIVGRSPLAMMTVYHRAPELTGFGGVARRERPALHPHRRLGLLRRGSSLPGFPAAIGKVLKGDLRENAAGISRSSIERPLRQ